MPLHFDLSPSRRRFLGTTSALLGGGWLTRFASEAAESAGEGSETFALLSDTHIAADEARVMRDVDLCLHLRTVLGEVKALAQPATALFLNGDAALTDGQLADYEQLMKQLRLLSGEKAPAVHVNLGNHDDRANFRAIAKPGLASPVESKHVALVEGRHVNWFLLDTLKVVNQVEGELGEEQRAWLDAALKQHADKPAIVMGHHNPQFPPSPEPTALDKAATVGQFRITGLEDSQPLMDVLERHRHVKAYVFGHTHAWTSQTRESGLRLINLPPVAYVFQKERPSGWVKVTAGPGGIVFTLQALDKAHPEHGATVELASQGA